MSQKHKDFVILFFLITVVTVLLAVNVAEAEPFIPDKPDNVVYDPITRTIDFASLTLEQKIAQMVIVFGEDENREALQNLLVGGIFLETKPRAVDFRKSIDAFQKESVVPFLITADVEGCRNPFENFLILPSFSDIETPREAYQVGMTAGEILRKLGFTMNLAPVVDLEDTIWNCRSFSGTAKEVAEKAQNYVAGLRKQGVVAVAKHYPGKTLVVSDSHNQLAKATIEAQDLLPFEEILERNISAIMVSHVIVTGIVDSGGKPSVVSSDLVNNLRNSFTGLIVTDEIGMLGLRTYYRENKSFTDFRQLFIDIFSTDNDLVLTFDRNPKNINRMVNIVADAVREGEISEGRIDQSVRRIFALKKLEVIN